MPAEGNSNLKPDLNIAFVSAVGSHAQQVEVATKNLLGKKTYDMKSQELLDVERKKYGGMKMSESAEKREGNFGKKVLTFFERVWKTSITRPLHEVKEARVGGELMIAAGLDTAITAEFDAVIDAKARERIEAKRDVWYKKLGGGISDFANELIGREKELHREKIKVTGDLRSEYLSNPGDKSHPFHQLLHRDTLARESLAEKFATAPADFLHEKDLRSDTVDLDHNSPISKFLKDTVFKDVIGDTIDQIDAGNYTGNISEKKRLDLDKKLKDFFFTDEFTAWRNGLPEAQRAQFENSLTYTTNVLSQAESVILPLVKDNLSHFRTNRELEFNIKLTLGTGQFGPNSELTGISRFSKERISKNATLYERMRAKVVSEPNFLYSADYMRMGNAQRVSLAALNSVATSEVVSAVAGIATGKGIIAALHANIEWVPIVGGLFAGGMAGYKEYNEVGKMRDRFGAQIAEGYTHPAGINAVRAEALRKVDYHRVDLGVRALDLKNVVDKLKSGDQSEETILNTLGFLADSKARTSLSDKRHINLFRASSDTPGGRGNFQQQDMIHAKLRVLATGELNTLLTTNDALRQQIATKLGYNPNYTVTQMLDSLSASQAEYLEKGTSVSTSVQLALHAITPAEAKAIDAQDKAFNKYRSKEVLKKAVFSGVLAGVATWGIGHFVTGHDEVVAGGVAHKSEIVLDHAVPSHVSPVTIGEVQDPNTHEILASMNAHIPQGTTLQADIQHPGAFDLVLANDPHRVLVNDMTFTDGHLNMTTEIRDALAHSHIQYRGVPTGSIDIAGQAGGFNPGETMTLTYGNMPGANEGGLDQWIANQLNHSFRALPEPKIPDQIPVERVTDINGIRFLYHAFEQHEKSLNHDVYSLDQIPGYVRKIHEHATTGTILTEPQASTFSIHDVPSVMGTEDGQRKIADLIHEAVRQKLSGQPFSDEAHRIMYEASYMGTTDKIPDPKEFEIVMQYLGAGAASAPTQGVSAQLNDAFFTMTGDLIDVKTVPLADVINHVAQYNVVGGLVSTFGYSVPLEEAVGNIKVATTPTPTPTPVTPPTLYGSSYGYGYQGGTRGSINNIQIETTEEQRIRQNLPNLLIQAFQQWGTPEPDQEHVRGLTWPEQYDWLQNQARINTAPSTQPTPMQSPVNNPITIDTLAAQLGANLTPVVSESTPIAPPVEAVQTPAIDSDKSSIPELELFIADENDSPVKPEDKAEAIVRMKEFASLGDLDEAVAKNGIKKEAALSMYQQMIKWMKVHKVADIEGDNTGFDKTTYDKIQAFAKSTFWTPSPNPLAVKQLSNALMNLVLEFGSKYHLNDNSSEDANTANMFVLFAAYERVKETKYRD